MTTETAQKPKRGRGRPEFTATPAQRRKVSVLKAGGMANQDIADGLGISRNTLEKYFERDLTVGAIERRSEVLQALHRSAKKGNVAAIRLFQQMQPILDPPPLPTAENGDEVKKPEGKKAQADEAAKTATQGTGWGPLLKPPAQVQ